MIRFEPLETRCEEVFLGERELGLGAVVGNKGGLEAH